MRQRTAAVFLMHLVQDVNVLRPLIYMAARDFGFDTLLLVSAGFHGRDHFGIWRAELARISSEIGARIATFGTDWEAHRELAGRGFIISASESSLPNHAITHNVFRHAPGSYLRVTIQHGLECVGLRHSVDHDRAHGQTVSFGADVICAWSAPANLSSLASSQRGKVVVTGPTSVLQRHDGDVSPEANAPGIVCENLHSVRMGGASHVRQEFVQAFEQFARMMADRGLEVAVRPHPGGQYALKHKLSLPRNIRIRNEPLYRLDLREFSYGISAPSSVLIDMVLAGLPTAVWHDSRDDIDASAYEGLTTVSSADEWVEFAVAAHRNPDAIRRQQTDYLEKQRIPLEPQDVFARYARLFQSVDRDPAL